MKRWTVPFSPTGGARKPYSRSPPGASGSSVSVFLLRATLRTFESVVIVAGALVEPALQRAVVALLFPEADPESLPASAALCSNCRQTCFISPALVWNSLTGFPPDLPSGIQPAGECGTRCHTHRRTFRGTLPELRSIPVFLSDIHPLPLPVRYRWSKQHTGRPGRALQWGWLPPILQLVPVPLRLQV